VDDGEKKSQKKEKGRKRKEKKRNLNQGFGGGRSLEFHRHHRGFEHSNLKSFLYIIISIFVRVFFNLSFFLFHPCGRDSSIIWMLVFFIHLIYVLFSNQTMGF
jgi:hypothetical protein